jgi:two-component system phosphate regulon response regulator PhoB
VGRGQRAAPQRDAAVSAKVLIVEDEPDILELAAYNLGQAGFEVDTAADGETGLKRATETLPDLIVLDLMLPGIDGFEVCRLLKQTEATRHIPVLMLTARAAEIDRVVGLELGADDYVVKPFSPRELVLRIKAILRRGHGAGEPQADGDILVAGPLSIDPGAFRVTLRGEPLQLTATEFKLLLTLVRRRGRVQSRGELLHSVWDYQFEGYARTVDTHIRRLREKLGKDAALVQTVRGVGYCLRGEEH